MTTTKKRAKRYARHINQKNEKFGLNHSSNTHLSWSQNPLRPGFTCKYLLSDLVGMLLCYCLKMRRISLSFQSVAIGYPLLTKSTHATRPSVWWLLLLAPTNILSLFHHDFRVDDFQSALTRSLDAQIFISYKFLPELFKTPNHLQHMMSGGVLAYRGLS